MPRSLKASGDLHVQLDVFGQARPGEVGGADQGGGADHGEACVCDVSLGMKLCLAIDAADDLAGSDGLDDGGNAGEEVILEFFSFEAAVEPIANALQPLGEGGPRPPRYLIAHQDADAIDLPP